MGMWQNIKTALLLALLDALFLVVGGLVGHRTGLIVAAVIALAVNAISYWKSDSIAVRAAHAVEVSPQQAPELHQIVAELSAAAGMPNRADCVLDVRCAFRSTLLSSMA